MTALSKTRCAQVLAKLESRQSLFNFKEITSAADGIIMSRGNLGLDVVPEKMALIQKACLLECAESAVLKRRVHLQHNKRCDSADAALAVSMSAIRNLAPSERTSGSPSGLATCRR